MRLFTLVFIGLLWAIPAQAVVYFDSDFNVALPANGGGFNSEGWQVFGNNSGWGNGAITSTRAYAGTGLQMNWTDPQPANGNGGVMQVNHRFPNTKVVYGRMYYGVSNPINVCNSALSNWLTVIKPHCGSDAAGNGIVKILFTEADGTIAQSGNNPRLIISDYFGNYAYDLQSSYDNLDALGHKPTLIASNVPVSKTGLDLVEWAIILNTPGQSNGSGFLWVNGNQVVGITGRQFVGPTPTSIDRHGSIVSSLMQYANFQLVVQNQAAYGSSAFWDRVAAGNTRIGPASGGPQPGDTTPPAIPSGLGVIQQ